MVWWFSWVQFGAGVLTGLICLGAALSRRKPNDLTVGLVAVTWLLLLVQLVVVLLAPALGNQIRGDGLELWMYLICALLIPPLAVLWSLIERVRWSNAVLAIAAFAVAVMVIRMQQIWLDVPSIIGQVN